MKLSTLVDQANKLIEQIGDLPVFIMGPEDYSEPVDCFVVGHDENDKPVVVSLCDESFADAFDSHVGMEDKVNETSH